MSRDDIPVTVDIVDVVPGAVKVRGDELAVGDTVFDAYGGKYLLVNVRLYTRRVTVIRDDGGRFGLDRDETITIIRGQR